MKQQKGCRMNCDVGKTRKGWRMRQSILSIRVHTLILNYIRKTAHSPTLLPLYLRQSSFYNPSVASPTSQLILQPFRHFTYVTAHSPTLPLFHLRHNSFCNLSVALPTSQIIQPFFRFSYVTGSSVTSPEEPSMLGHRD